MQFSNNCCKIFGQSTFGRSTHLTVQPEQWQSEKLWGFAESVRQSQQSASFRFSECGSYCRCDGVGLDETPSAGLEDFQTFFVLLCCCDDCTAVSTIDISGVSLPLSAQRCLCHNSGFSWKFHPKGRHSGKFSKGHCRKLLNIKHFTIMFLIDQILHI